MDFLGVVEWAFCWVFRKKRCWLWWFCGQLVERSVANVDSGRAAFGEEKIGTSGNFIYPQV